MTSSEKLCLQWNDFQENLNSAFKELRNDTELSDVTLVSDDEKQVEVHKVILASSSPFFANLLKRNKHPHPTSTNLLERGEGRGVGGHS